jgi:tetratricopeptide (TPR) repeat protein
MQDTNSHFVRAVQCCNRRQVMTVIGLLVAVATIWEIKGLRSVQAGNPGAEQTKLDYAPVAQGLAMEDLAWLLGDRTSYADAIKSFTQAIDQNGQQGKSLIDRGRCYYKCAISRDELALLREAQEDLKEAIKKNPPKGQKVEALYWLGLSFSKQLVPEFDQAQNYMAEAVQITEQDGTFSGSFAYGLEALAALGELALKRNEEDPGNGEAYLTTATAYFDKLGQYARRCENEKHEFWAANRMRTIGEIYELKNEPVKALTVYQKGLPADLGKALVAHVRLLSVRNALFTKLVFKEALRNHKPEGAALLADARRGLELALKKHQWTVPRDRAESYLSAALCYFENGERGIAFNYLDRAMEMSPDPLLSELIKERKKDWERK